MRVEALEVRGPVLRWVKVPVRHYDGHGYGVEGGIRSVDRRRRTGTSLLDGLGAMLCLGLRWFRIRSIERVRACE